MTWLGKGEVEVGGDSRAERDGSELDESELDGNKVDGGEFGDDEVGKKVQNLSKSKTMVRSDFFTLQAKLAFAKLSQAFVKAPILHHFDLERHIRIEMDASGYAIGGVLNQLTSDNSGWGHPVAFFSQKMIPAETRYKTHDGELLAIVEAFKTWRHYLEGSQHEVLVLTDHNNLRRFMNTKSLSSRQIRWAHELFRYHFRIDYRQGKANGAADALSWYPQQSAEEEETLRDENVKILHRLQFLLTNASLSSLSTSVELLPLHQVLICGTYILPQLRQFWDNIRGKLVNGGPYKVNISGMSLRLSELQELDQEAQELKSKEQLSDGWEDIDGVLHHQRLLFIPKVIWTKLISQYHDDPLVGHFGIDKTKNLVGRKYHWPSLQRDIEVYVKGCDVCLGSKAVRHKPYGDLQFLPIPTHQ